jgi:hypothetical protein
MNWDQERRSCEDAKQFAAQALRAYANEQGVTLDEAGKPVFPEPKAQAVVDHYEELANQLTAAKARRDQLKTDHPELFGTAQTPSRRGGRGFGRGGRGATRASARH